MDSPYTNASLNRGRQSKFKVCVQIMVMFHSLYLHSILYLSCQYCTECNNDENIEHGTPVYQQIIVISWYLPIINIINMPQERALGQELAPLAQITLPKSSALSGKKKNLLH